MHSEITFLRNTNAIRTALRLSPKEYVSKFGMTSEEALKHLLNSDDFPLRFAMNFCEHYGLDLKTMFSDDFDVTAFSHNYFNDSPVLPEIYQREKNSRAITLLNIARGLEASGYGWLNDMIFRRLQIPSNLLRFPDHAVPVKLIYDYLELVETFQKEPEMMTVFGVEGIANLNRRYQLVNASTAFSVEFYDRFFSEHIRKFDKSYDYQVTGRAHKSLTVECRLKDEFKDVYKTKSLSNRAFLSYKAGIGCGLSVLFGFGRSEASIIRSDRRTGTDVISIRLPRPLLSSYSYLH